MIFLHAMFRAFVILFFSILIANSLLAQAYLTGYVYEKIKSEGQTKFQPLVGASVYWKNTQVGTTTNEKGLFRIKKVADSNILIVSYVGYKADTLRIPESQKDINIVLEAIQTLSEIEVEARQKGEYIDKLNPIKTEVITTAGLQKLACCNLSESFENSGTVDVNYSDAISGAKQIQMLGLAGTYSQLLGENMPLNNYLSYGHGLTFIPGTWMQSIQVSKGTSSVINGFESITGQINVEFKKPHLSDLFFVNLYSNSEGKIELNSDVNFHVNEHLSSGTLIHAESQLMKIDHNHDDFLDVPLNKQINLFQRFNYEKENKLCFQYGLKVLHDEKVGGQKQYNPNLSIDSQQSYGVEITNQRYELITKHGFILPRRSTSLGVQWSGTYHKQDALFGKSTYRAQEKYFYANAIFNTYLFSDEHKIDVGTSYIISDLNQDISIFNFDTVWNTKNHIPGAFLQYSFHYHHVFSAILGFRTDYSTFAQQWIYTPRLHLRYEISEYSLLRGSVGKGSRFSVPVSENINYLASSRQWIFLTDNFFEDAWNYGLSFTQKIKFSENRNIQLTADYYHTWFTQQLVVDPFQNPYQVSIYQLNGKSFSRSYLLNVDVNLVKSLEFSLIGRYNDVQTTFADGALKAKPMVVPLKLLGTFSYSTPYDKWQFNLTAQWNSATTLPDMSQNPQAIHVPTKSDPYTILHAQITRRFKVWEAYVGAENILNVRQHHPVVAYNDPFGVNFDASIVYAPIMGRMYYIGFRYTLKNKKI